MKTALALVMMLSAVPAFANNTVDAIIAGMEHAQHTPRPVPNYHDDERPAGAKADGAGDVGQRSSPKVVDPEQDWKDEQAFFLYGSCVNGCTPVGRIIRGACRIAMNRTGNNGVVSCGVDWGSNGLFTVNGGKMQYATHGGPGQTWVGLDFSRIFSYEKMEQIRAQCEPDLPCVGHATFKIVQPYENITRVVLLDFD